MSRLRSRLKTLGFLLLNAWLVFHVFAIFIAPAGMPPASPLLVDASRVAQPYNDALFLNHGYHYFAPDPGASTLVSWRIERPGALAVKGRFPDRETWPRLLYHRYFMLADNLGGFPEDMQEEIYTAYARQLAQQHDSQTIALSLLRHHPSSIIRMQAGGRLSDAETFQEERLGEWDFTPPLEMPADFDGRPAPPAIGPAFESAFGTAPESVIEPALVPALEQAVEPEHEPTNAPDVPAEDVTP